MSAHATQRELAPSIPGRRPARLQVRHFTYHGIEGWKIVGRDTTGRRVNIFSERESEARRMARDIREGRETLFDSQIERSRGAV